MRNISTSQKYTTTIAILCGEYGNGIDIGTFATCLVELSEALQVKLERAYSYLLWSIEDGLTPSEMGVLDEFENFIIASMPKIKTLPAREGIGPYSFPVYSMNTSFTYMNLNTGRNVCFMQVYI